MAFIMDRQTYADLEILEAYGVKNNIFKLFDRALTQGGREKLFNIFNHPLSDSGKIRERQEAISYMYREKLLFPVDSISLGFIESYLLMGDKPNRLSRLNAWHKALKYLFNPVNENYLIQRGIEYVIEVLQKLYVFASENAGQNLPPLLEQYFQTITDSLANTELRRIIGFNTKRKIRPMERERFDYIFRYHKYDRLKGILQILYQIDAFQAVAYTMAELGLIFPEIVEGKVIEINGLVHPYISDAVANNIMLNEKGNLFFITGANMAGKSTFLKAFGVAVYLAHLGFPVAASSMRTGVFNGLFSTINIADNLNKGYSHFYAEVLRVKNVAEEINRTGNLVVIFDELFRGTNVKDAYDASLSIISAFAKVSGSMFLISTHIMEVADQLSSIDNIRFGYFYTTIDDKTPVYSYQLHEGVTTERLGMLIIENERIIEIIKKGIKKLSCQIS